MRHYQASAGDAMHGRQGKLPVSFREWNYARNQARGRRKAMAKMTSKQIAEKADALRKEGIGMSNYTRVFNDALVLIRELALKVAALEAGARK
jgi:hypothetical protein